MSDLQLLFTRRRRTVAEIQQAVARFYHLRQDALIGPRRHYEVSRPRQVAMYLARKHTRASFPQIGRLFRRDHSTIVHGVQMVKQRLIGDAQLGRDVAKIESILGAGEQRVNRCAAANWS